MAATGNEALSKACAELRAAGFDGALLGSIANVTWVTGVEVPIPYGAGPALTYSSWLALVDAREETGWAIVPNSAVAAFADPASGFTAAPFDTFDSFAPTEPRASYIGAIGTALAAAGFAGKGPAIAVESGAVPAVAAGVLKQALPGARIDEAEGILSRARLIRTARDIEGLRFAARLADAAHETLATLCHEAGQNELAMWAEINLAVNRLAGRDVVLTGELVTGPRTTTVLYPNGPRDRETERGDAALMDLSARHNGYWFDCTNTHLIGGVEPTAEVKRYANASRDACEAAMAALRPGALARDAALAAERAFAQHGLPMAHYAGHQIGVTVNELPRLVPYDDTPIEAGMVFSVEPGAYMGPGGVFGARSEKMVLVRADGPEVLSTFQWGIA